MATDTSEKGLETIIEAYLTDSKGERAESTRWVKRTSSDFNRDYCLDEDMLRAFLENTQKDKVVSTRIYDTPVNTRKFLERLRNQITKRGIVDVLRHGIEHNTIQIDLYYPLPVAANVQAKIAYAQNRWSVVRQLHFSKTNTADSVDMVLMLNGLPIVTMELKNELSCQNVENAITQYKTDRDAKELLFMPKRCAVHFAVDDAEVMMCTALAGQDSWFLPFNKGVNDGAGNPVNPNGLKTAYLWEDIFQKERLSDIIENYAQVITERDGSTGKAKEKCIWPRYHQLEAVRALLADTAAKEGGDRYLIQHSAGSGKSNSITWLAFQLVNMKQADNITPRFESIIVVTDRVNLDKQIRDNIRAFCNNKSIVQWADDSEALRNAISGGKKIIVSTICKFPFILQALGRELANRKFAVIIDEAHSSQSGSMQSSLNRVLSGYGHKDVNIEDNEDGLNELLEYVVAGRLMAKNTNFYAFTATPKNKTLEMFGTPCEGENGETAYKPFHLYSMRQAIEEGFIMDVLEHYTTYDSYYKIIKSTESNPEFDKDQAAKKLRVWVESRPETVAKKARIMVEHFHENVANKIGGEARAMIICNGIVRAIDYYYAVKELLKKRNSPYKPIIAFSGTKEYMGKQLDEAYLNGFPSSAIEKTFRSGTYRFLIVADKFQTGYDEPLLHTMYVDKPLSDVKTVQTLSRLNRCHPMKKETYVLDFVNSAEDIQKDFQRYYKKTILSHETDVNKLSDKLDICDGSMIYEEEEVELFNNKYWSGASREEIDPILDVCVERFKNLPNDEDENKQIEVKGAMKQFVRLYEFLTALMEIQRIDWEKKNTFFHFLLRKLPKIERDDWADGLIDLVDFDKYRVVRRGEKNIQLENINTTVDPIPVGDTRGTLDNPDMVALDQIVDDFNQVFGDIDWGDPDTVRHQIRQVVSKLQKSDEVRDSMLNNDEDTQIQVIHDNISSELGIVTANSSEMQRRYLSQPSIQAQLDNLILMRLQEQINPAINEQLLTQTLIEEFHNDFVNLCGVRYRSLEEVVDWFFRVLDTPTIDSLDGIKKLKRIVNLIYHTQGRNEDMHDWLQQLLGRFEAYMKKMYYIAEDRELTKENGGFVQFLDTARALGVNDLHFTHDVVLQNMKTYYDFVHAQRNEESHNAPVINDNEVSAAIHMSMAMYLYATMINITNMEGSYEYAPIEEEPIAMAADNLTAYGLPEEEKKDILRKAIVRLGNIFSKQRHWEAIYRVAVDKAFVIDNDYTYFCDVMHELNIDGIPTIPSFDKIEKMNCGIYANSLLDWTADGLQDNKLTEYTDIKQCADKLWETVEDILKNNPYKNIEND